MTKRYLLQIDCGSREAKESIKSLAKEKGMTITGLVKYALRKVFNIKL